MEKDGKHQDPKLQAGDEERLAEALINLKPQFLRLFAWITVPFVIPFAIYSLFVERYIIFLFLVVLALLATTVSIQHYKRHIFFLPYWIFYIIKLLAVLFTLHNYGIIALFWAYPVCIAIVFIARRESIIYMILIAYISLAVSAFYYIELEYATRFAVTLAVVCLFCYLLERQIAEAQYSLGNLVNRDGLTNAFNRRYMDEILQSTVEEILRGLGTASILIIDIDKFKSINDNYGHEAGDHVLIELVGLLHDRQRKLDYVFRMGGEEFLLLLRNTGETDAADVAESIRSKVESTLFSDQRKITISIGVAEYISNEAWDEWLSRADKAMYAAKVKGRNRVETA